MSCSPKASITPRRGPSSRCPASLTSAPTIFIPGAAAIILTLFSRIPRRAKACSSASIISDPGPRESGTLATTRRAVSPIQSQLELHTEPLAPGAPSTRPIASSACTRATSTPPASSFRTGRRRISGTTPASSISGHGHLQRPLERPGHKQRTDLHTKGCGALRTCAGAPAQRSRTRTISGLTSAAAAFGKESMGGAGAVSGAVGDALPAVDAAAALRSGHAAGRASRVGADPKVPEGVSGWYGLDSASRRKARTITCASSCSSARSATARSTGGWTAG